MALTLVKNTSSSKITELLLNRIEGALITLGFYKTESVRGGTIWQNVSLDRWVIVHSMRSTAGKVLIGRGGKTEAVFNFRDRSREEIETTLARFFKEQDRGQRHD